MVPATTSRADARTRHVYLVAAAIGLIACVWVYGPSHLIGTSSYWEMPEADERMAMIGYRYFLAHAWHWPLFDNDAVNVPYAKSLAYLDVIPIWALINKAIATIVPPWRSFSAHAYLGLWHALCYALQTCFGVAILRALGHKTWRDAILGALFFLAVPTWIFRYAHPALQAHWVELWALYLYLASPARASSPTRLGVAKIAQLVVAAMISPYHTVICLPVFVASLLRSRDRRTIAVWLPIGLAAIVLAAWVAGYFAADGAKPQWGFDQESANALDWLVPQRSGIVGDARWLANVDATGYQYEGYAYLGLGYLVLLAIFVRRAPAAIRRHAALFAVVLGFCMLALSNRIYVGSHEVVSYPIPSVLKWLPGQFRSPGRFVWLPTYVLIAFLLHHAVRRFSTTRGGLVLGALVLLQLADARGDWSLQQTFTRGPREFLVHHEQWRQLVRAHDAVFTVPAFSCSSGERPDLLDFVAMDLQWFASDRAVPINGTYATRVRRRCGFEIRDWATAPLRPNTLYVLFPEGTAVADRFSAEGAHCGVFAYGRVCSTNSAAIDTAIGAGLLQVPPPPIALEVGQPLELAGAPLGGAWSAPESGGRWTLGGLADIPIHLEGTLSPASVEIAARARICGLRTNQDVDVLEDDQLVATLHFTDEQPITQTVRLPAIHAEVLVLQLRPRDTRSPATVKCDSDTRRIGVWVSSLTFSTGGGITSREVSWRAIVGDACGAGRCSSIATAP